MPTYPQRPVDEVVFSVMFGETATLTGPRLGLVVGGLLEEFPQVETQPPYEMQLELPLEKQGLIAGGPVFEILGGSNGYKARNWLISVDETQLVQIQSDYLGFNWRRRGPDQTYPGFVVLRDKFEGVFQDINSSVKARESSGLLPRQAELTYVNILRPDDSWHTYRDTHEVVRLWFPDIESYERVALNYSKAIEVESTGFAGRLHVNVQPAFDTARQSPVINLTLTARSAILEEQSVEAALGFIDLAHSYVIDTFRSLITDKAREEWGMS